MENQKTQKLTWLSFFMYLVSASLKILAGYYFNTQAILADGLHNTSDCINMIFIIIGLKIASRPVDDNHRYGHQKAEAVATLIMSILILYVGFEVVFDNVKDLIAGEIKSPNPLAAGVALLCGTIILVMYFINRHYSNKLNNLSLKAIAADNLSDALTSYATALAVVFSHFGLSFLDPIAAIVVGILIIKSGVDVFKDSFLILTDGFPPELADQYSHEISQLPDVKKVKRLQGRQYGSEYIIDVIILVDKNLTVSQGHDITETIAEYMLENHQEVIEVFVHVEPYEDDYIHQLRDDHIQQDY